MLIARQIQAAKKDDFCVELVFKTCLFLLLSSKFLPLDRGGWLGRVVGPEDTPLFCLLLGRFLAFFSCAVLCSLDPSLILCAGKYGLFCHSTRFTGCVCWFTEPCFEATSRPAWKKPKITLSDRVQRVSVHLLNSYFV